MIQRKHIKAVWICIVLCCICTMAAGCKQKPDENGSLKAEDGRSYGGTIKGKQGDNVQTAFFDMTVDSVTKSNTFQFEDGLYQAEEGKTYLVVTLTIKNTYEKDIPMSITDFVLDYDGNQSEDVITGYGKADLNQEDYMENVFTLKKGESVSKSILFTIEDKDAYTLKYSEYYADQFDGDSYEIALTPQTETEE